MSTEQVGAGGACIEDVSADDASEWQYDRRERFGDEFGKAIGEYKGTYVEVREGALGLCVHRREDGECIASETLPYEKADDLLEGYLPETAKELRDVYVAAMEASEDVTDDSACTTGVPYWE